MEISSSFSRPFPVYRRGRHFSSACQSALTRVIAVDHGNIITRYISNISLYPALHSLNSRNSFYSFTIWRTFPSILAHSKHKYQHVFSLPSWSEIERLSLSLWGEPCNVFYMRISLKKFSLFYVSRFLPTSRLHVLCLCWGICVYLKSVYV
jgi:hypothetical protein